MLKNSQGAKVIRSGGVAPAHICLVTLHPNQPINIYGWGASQDAYVTVMEYVCGVDLMRVVERSSFLPIDQVRLVMAQLILAVEHLHLKGFLHRDIKVSK